MKKNINLEMGAQNMDKHITTPITAEVTKNLKSGDYVYITGTIYVARDAAHKRMIEALERGEELPIDIKDSTILSAVDPYSRKFALIAAKPNIHKKLIAGMSVTITLFATELRTTTVPITSTPPDFTIPL
jgi:hypothetical protein